MAAEDNANAAKLECEPNEKIEMLKELDSLCSKLYSPYYTICDNLYSSLKQLKKLYPKKEGGKQRNVAAVLSEEEKRCLEEAKQCHQRMLESCTSFKYELASFHGFLYELANLIDPNHDIDF